MTHPSIRPMCRADLPLAQNLIAAVDLFPPELLPDMAEAFLSGRSEERWLFAGEGDGIAYVAPERMTEGTWNLLLLATHPARQGTGLGRALVAEIEAALRAIGARLLIVETSGVPDFAGPRAFYARLGYVAEARIRDFYQAGDDKVIFTKALARTPDR